jgi:hypothetical protein
MMIFKKEMIDFLKKKKDSFKKKLDNENEKNQLTGIDIE